MRHDGAHIRPWIHIGEVVRDLVDDLVRVMAERPSEADIEPREQDDE